MTPGTPTRRKPGLAIYWQPVDDAYFRLAAMLRTSRQATPIYMVQRVIADVEAHCRESSSPLVYGLLIGEPCVEPKTNREFLLIDGALRAPPYASGGDPAGVIAPNLASLTAEAARHGKLPMGWYRGGRTAAAAKARAEVAFHRRTFTDPWQVMLVIDGGDVSRGTFVRIEPSDGRAYSAPFFELLPDGARSEGGRLGTVVRWENYHTLDFVAPLATAGVPRPAPVAAVSGESRRIITRDPVVHDAPVVRETPRAPRADAVAAPTTAEMRFAPPPAPLPERAATIRAAGLADAHAPPGESPSIPTPLPATTRDADPVGEATGLRPAAPAAVERRAEVVTFPIIVPPRADGDGSGPRQLRRWATAGVALGVALLAARFGARRERR